MIKWWKFWRWSKVDGKDSQGRKVVRRYYTRDSGEVIFVDEKVTKK